MNSTRQDPRLDLTPPEQDCVPRPGAGPREFVPGAAIAAGVDIAWAAFRAARAANLQNVPPSTPANHPQTVGPGCVAVPFADCDWIVDLEIDTPEAGDETHGCPRPTAFAIVHAVKLNGRWFWVEDALTSDLIDGIERAALLMPSNTEVSG